MISIPSPFARSQFCWAKDLPPGRNQFVSFERRFSLGPGEAATLHVFADTRYRLWVNGEFVAYGPGRFVTKHPEYDTHDLNHLLREGDNLVRVEVNYYGTSSFQTMPDGMPGFIAAGGTKDGLIDFDTPGDWKARVHQAWDARAASFSFAQNPGEVCDTRVLAEELASASAQNVVRLPAESTPWPKPVPRSAPYPDYALVEPARLLVAGPLAEARRWGMQITRPDKRDPDVAAKSLRLMFSTWIHSPRDQEVLLDCFWAFLEVNGRGVTIVYPKHLGNHGHAQVSLHAGWNFLGGNFEIILEHWSFLLGLPPDSGATLHGLPDLACAEPFALSRIVETSGVPPCPASPEEFDLPPDWELVANQISRVTPSRLTAWDSPVASASRYDVPREKFPEIATQVAREAVWSFDFRDEYYGQPVLEVEAPAGSVLDIAYDDWKRADGCVALYRSNPVVDAADRFILRGGRQRIDVVNPRGGIYLEVILRAPEGSAPVELSVHQVAVRRRITIPKTEGNFTSGDPVLDWAWKTSVHTLQAATDEAYSDCPWRERGSYIGDTLVNIHLHRLATADLSVAKRMLTVMGQAKREDGQLPGCSPSWMRGAGIDFTLLWIQAVRDVWAFTGDVEFLAVQWPVLLGIWNSPTWRTDASGLWDMTDTNVFLDWGLINSERTGAGNCAINVLRAAGARAISEIAGALKLEPDRQKFVREADEISAAICAHLWNKAEARFNPSLGGTTTALHANILALRYGVGPAADILAYLEPKLRENFATGSKYRDSGHAELYFFFYLFSALAAQGKFELVETMIQEHYGFLKSLNYPTLPECFHAADQQQGSCCHSWSGSAAIYATAHILGLRQEKNGDPDVYLLDPSSSPHAHAEGSVPHPRGKIMVKWKREGPRISAEAVLPKGVTLHAVGHVALTVNS